MYIISNYLSIIIVIGIIDNLAADYPTQFFLMRSREIRANPPSNSRFSEYSQVAG